MRYKLSRLIIITCLLYGCKKDMGVAAPWQTGMLEAVNRLRLSGCRCGADSMPPVAPLAWNDTLAAAADLHVKDMYAKQYFDHIAPDGSSPLQRAMRAGYSGTYVGENIGRGYTSVSGVMQAWQDSGEHCRAMMDSLYKEMGAATFRGYWVQEFGRPR
ncbi:CAP domain-containing protein [Chitinophaga japonensis]|uniref:Uncharacterized protein YkwD n=1 Tax=Chitinophaga japonensis TaxID=104662 RepID=A0A562SL47_CHIJA|nr:CAP domain-containing protein [Chitinophaga japonensis]TWI82015.1 uncharacterized protein YkwD [Chitinophaga japonensis]